MVATGCVDGASGVWFVSMGDTFLYEAYDLSIYRVTAHFVRTKAFLTEL